MALNICVTPRDRRPHRLERRCAMAGAQNHAGRRQPRLVRRGHAFRRQRHQHPLIASLSQRLQQRQIAPRPAPGSTRRDARRAAPGLGTAPRNECRAPPAAATAGRAAISRGAHRGRRHW